MCGFGLLQRGVRMDLCLLPLSERVKYQCADGTRTIPLNGENLVPELIKNCQCLVIELRYRSSSNEPTEIEMSCRQLAPRNSLRLKHLPESIQSTQSVSETDKAFGAVMVNRCKLCIISPLGQNQFE